MRNPSPAGQNPRKSWPIVTYLVFGVSALVFLSVAGVLFVTLTIATRNTLELLEDKSRLLMTSIVHQADQFVKPIQAQVELLAELIKSGGLDPADPQRLFEALRASLAASPQMRSTIFLHPSGWTMAAIRSEGRIEPSIDDWRLDPTGRRAMEEALAKVESGAYWGAPVHFPASGVTVVNLRRPIFRNGEMIGLIASTISVRDLSQFITGLETELGQNAFVLYNRDRVLAHSALLLNFPGLSRERPLPHLTEIGDPVLFNIWRERWQDRALEIDVVGHWDEVGGAEYIYLYRPLEDIGDARWLVGSYFLADTVTTQLDRLFMALGLGVVALVAAVIIGLLLGRRVSRPVAELAAAATAIRSLELDDVEPLRRSRLREIDGTAIAFNAMVRALRLFAGYVPKQLVQSLIRRGVTASLASETREVTVLFTDIAGFTSRTEALSAEQTAHFLNHHFDLLTRCIEVESGTIDKFIGDGVMALWNALDEQPDHAVRAARAARLMVDAVRNDGGDPPVRLRIGIHSGPAVVGNIGTSSRMNYTAVGSTVNVAQRLQSLGGELVPGADAVVVLSAASAVRLPAELEIRSLGCHRLRGRIEPTEIFQLVV